MAEGNKTEKATPKKRRDERKQGNVLKSQDVTSVATLVAVFGVFWIIANSIADQVGRFMELCISLSTQSNGEIGNLTPQFWGQALMVVVKCVLPMMAATMIVAIAVTLFQTKFLVAPEAMKPKFSRINPLQGIKRLFFP